MKIDRLIGILSLLLQKCPGTRSFGGDGIPKKYSTQGLV